MTNIPATVWQPRGQEEGEFSSSSAVAIIDPTDSSIFLIDPTDSTIEIVSTTTTFTGLPSTTWTKSDGS